ncbi:hypothetical protein D0T84_21095, partial [Dysgonomonas sp. 521]|nr:hypothetical protein [Dysgonomonas sp. 521]
MKTTKTLTNCAYYPQYGLSVLLVVLLLFSLRAGAQITIGANLEPEKGALLNLKTTDVAGANSSQGLGMPRVYLVDENALFPMFDKDKSDAGDYKDSKGNTVLDRTTADKTHIGLTVYNISDEDPFCPGIYVWHGTVWERLPEPCTGNTQPTNLIFAPNYNIDAGSTTLYVNTAGSFTQGTTDEYTRGSGVAHSEMAAGVFKYTGAEGEAFAGYTYNHASGITVTIDAATLATGAGELPVKVSGTVDA